MEEKHLSDHLCVFCNLNFSFRKLYNFFNKMINGDLEDDKLDFNHSTLISGYVHGCAENELDADDSLSWTEFNSTLLAGHYNMTIPASEMKDVKLSTVEEEASKLLSISQMSNSLNNSTASIYSCSKADVNLDALSDNEINLLTPNSPKIKEVRYFKFDQIDTEKEDDSANNISEFKSLSDHEITSTSQLSSSSSIQDSGIENTGALLEKFAADLQQAENRIPSSLFTINPSAEVSPGIVKKRINMLKEKCSKGDNQLFNSALKMKLYNCSSESEDQNNNNQEKMISTITGRKSIGPLPIPSVKALKNIFSPRGDQSRNKKQIQPSILVTFEN